MKSAAKTTKQAGKIVPPVMPQAPAAAKKGTRQVAAGTLSKKEDVKPAEITTEQREGERRAAQQSAIAQFAGGSMTTPAAHAPALTAEQQKKAAFDAEMAKLAEKFGQPIPSVVAKAPRAKQLAVNGITKPAEGTVTGSVWAAANAISIAQSGAPATISQVKAHATMHGVNEHTIKTQYSRWRQFNGIKGRLVVVKATTPEGDYPGMPVLK